MKKNNLDMVRLLVTIALSTLVILSGVIAIDEQIGVGIIQAKKVSWVKSTNKTIARDLKDAKGWADGTLDENGNPIENGEPNEEYSWATYIKGIKYSASNKEELGELTVQVYSEFNELSKSQKNDIMNMVEKSAISSIIEHQSLTTEDTSHGIYTSVNLVDGDTTLPLGNSKPTNYQKFSWTKY